MFTQKTTFPRILYILLLAMSLLFYIPINVSAEPAAIFNGSTQQAAFKPCFQAVMLIDAPNFKEPSAVGRDIFAVQCHALPPTHPCTLCQSSYYYINHVSHIFFTDTTHFAFRNIRCPPIA